MGTASFTVTVQLEGGAAPQYTVTGTAYLNATSPTGRTLSVITDATSTAFSIWKSGTKVLPTGDECTAGRCHVNSNSTPNGSDFQYSIPTAWVAGTYDVMSGSGFWDDPMQFTSTITVPELPEPEAEPAPDTVLPQVLVPDDITIETDNQDGASATFNPQAIDNIDELLTPTCNYTTGSVFPVGTTTVTCTATDAAGNTGIGTFAIIVTYIPPPDTTPPTISMLSDISDSTSDQNGKIITFTVTASDDVGVTSGPTCSPFSGSVFPVGTTTVTCTATDAAGNTNSSSFNVTIEFTGFSIPDWIKNVAGFWHADDINDDSFLGAIEYLIENNIIVVPTTESGSGGGTVPSWVKNNAGWWASDQIDDETFVNALQYLIQQGLIQV